MKLYSAQFAMIASEVVKALGKQGLIEIDATNIPEAELDVVGVLKEYRRHGIDAIMYRNYFTYGLAKGYSSGEFSWILEDNMAIRRPLEAFGSTIYKVYRLYETPVDD